MMKIKKHRYNSDCDSLHKFYLDAPMTFGGVPIDMDDDYGINGARYIMNSARIKSFSDWPTCAEASDVHFIVKAYKI